MYKSLTSSLLDSVRILRFVHTYQMAFVYSTDSDFYLAPRSLCYSSRRNILSCCFIPPWIIVMGRACCVLGCPSGGDAPSHQIPKNPALFQKWKSIIYSEKIQHLSDEQISKCAVCYRHFADDDYLVTFRVRKLKRGIAPSLNLPSKPASSVLDVIKIEPQTSSASMSTFDEKQVVKTEVMESQNIMEVVPEMKIALFQDTPEEDETCLFNQPETLPSKHSEQTSLPAETLKLNYREKLLRKKRRKLNTTHLSLQRCKRQAKQYEKTPTIQKLLSCLTPTEITFIKTRIRKSRYSPKVYVRVYRDIAKRKALGLF